MRLMTLLKASGITLHEHFPLVVGPGYSRLSAIKSTADDRLLRTFVATQVSNDRATIVTTLKIGSLDIKQNAY